MDPVCTGALDMSPIHSYSYHHTILQHHTHDMYHIYMTASPWLCSPLWHLWILAQQQLQYSPSHMLSSKLKSHGPECKRKASYLVSMRDNLATHHHINSYYIYVHSMDPVCTSWDISPIHVLLVRAVFSLVGRH